MVFEPTLDGVFPGNCLVDDTHAGCLAIKSPSCGVLGCGINPTSNSEVISRTFLYAEIPPGSHEIDLGAKMIGDGAGYIIDATLVVAAIP